MAPKKKNKSIFCIVIFSIIIFLFSSFLVWCAVPNDYFNFPRSSGIRKICFSNMRVFMGAIEMYNEDRKTGPYITSFTQSEYDLLIKEGYLKPNHDKANEYCKYLVNGDLSKGGYIYCEYHGSMDGSIKGYWEKVPPKNSSLAKLSKQLLLFGIALIPTLIYIIISIY